MQDLLKKLLIEAELAHGKYEREKLGGKHDDQWAGWYAAYMTEQLLNQNIVMKRQYEID